MTAPYVAMIVPLGAAPGMPDNTLPGGPNYPSQGLPGGPRPSHPIALPPLPPGFRPDNSLPGGGTIGGTPENPIYNPPAPDQGLPGAGISLPVRPDQGLPPGVGIYPPVPPGSVAPGTKVLVTVSVPGVGTRWAVVDLSLSATPPIAGTPTPKAG